MTALRQLLALCGSPLGIMTFLFAAGLLAKAIWPGSRGGRRLLLSGVLLYLLFLFTPLAEVAVATLERVYPPLLKTDPSGGIRTIVVLSGYGEDHPLFPVTSEMSGETITRMVEGIRLYRGLPGARLVISGGVVHKGDKPVANLMADFSRAMGVPDKDVVIEGRSSTTYENLVEVKKIVGETQFILVTSACVLPRAMAVARKLGMKPLGAPAGVWAAQHYPSGMSWPDLGSQLVRSVSRPSLERFSYLQRAYHEYVGILYYVMLDRV